MLRTLLVVAVSAACGPTTTAQLRIVTYNTLRDAHPSAATVLQGIGEENVGGVARPVDILMLQEQDEPFTTTQGVVDILNNLYGEGVYARLRRDRPQLIEPAAGGRLQHADGAAPE